MTAKSNVNIAVKEPKDLRYRNLYFPDAEHLVFDTARRGFVPLPIVLRKLMRHLSAPEFRILIYLYLRSSKYGICYPTQDEMAFELGLRGPRNVLPYLKKLEGKGLISTRTAMGRKFYLVHDPLVALQHLASKGHLSLEELHEINQLCLDLGQRTIEIPPVRRHKGEESNLVPQPQRHIRLE